MRIGIGGINHETNTYCAEPTPLSAFPRLTGERLLQRAGTETGVGGAIDTCHQMGLEPIPLMFAWTQPSGTIEAAANDQMKQELRSRLLVSLSQHSADTIVSKADDFLR